MIKKKNFSTHTYKLTQLITTVMSSCCKIGDLVGCSACNFGGNDADGVFVRVSTSSQAINPLCGDCDRSFEKLLAAASTKGDDDDDWNDELSGDDTEVQ
jgi:hypothetical protein